MDLKAMNNWDILIQLTFMVFVAANLIVEKCWEPHFPIQLASWGYAPFSDRAIFMEKNTSIFNPAIYGFFWPENSWGIKFLDILGRIDVTNRPSMKIQGPKMLDKNQLFYHY